MGEVVSELLGAFALGWCAGYLMLVFKRVMDKI